MALFFALVTICLFGNTLAQVPGLGGCPNVTTQENFDVSKYLGTWYEQYRYFATFEFGAECVSANYTAGPNNTIVVVNSQINSITGNPGSIQGIASAPDTSEPAKLKVQFEGVPVAGDYWVLETDYKNFAVVASCKDFTVFNVKFAWVLTRDRNASESVLATALELAEKNHLSSKLFLTTNQKDCEGKSADK